MKNYPFLPFFPQTLEKRLRNVSSRRRPPSRLQKQKRIPLLPAKERLDFIRVPKGRKRAGNLALTPTALTKAAWAKARHNIGKRFQADEGGGIGDRPKDTAFVEFGGARRAIEVKWLCHFGISDGWA
jgi:hypothetical protein